MIDDRLVPDPNEVKAFRNCSDTCIAAIGRFEYGGHIGVGSFFEANFQQCAHDISDHVVKESAAFDPVYEVPAALGEFRVTDLTYSVLSRRCSCGESAEVMGSNKQFCSSLHFAEVQRMDYVTNAPVQERRKDRAIEDPIFVALLPCTFLGMEVSRDPFQT